MNQEQTERVRTLIRQMESHRRWALATILMSILAITAAAVDLLHNACP